MLFEDFKISTELLEAIDYMGFREATPIQERAIPVILEGSDLIACAQTGTGKTAAFLLPVLDKIARKRSGHTHTLILVPTRELAVQIDQQVQGLGYTLDITSIAIYGGGDGKVWEQEKSALTRGADIIIATPGMLIAHLNQGYVKFGTVEALVLDEADRMLDIGFYDDIVKIISYIPKKRQTLMFSATMPPKIKALARHVLKNPEHIALEISKPAEGVEQVLYYVGEDHKVALVKHIIDENPSYSSILVFSSTKKKVSLIVRGLRNKSYMVEGISSDLAQKDREEILLKFRSRNVKVLVATDVLSRGIDIKDINMVINFDVPGDAEDYVHRVGRTARAETTGVAVTLVTRPDIPKLGRIEKLIGYSVPVSQLPSFLADIHDKHFEHTPEAPGAVKKRKVKKFKRKKGKDTGSAGGQRPESDK